MVDQAAPKMGRKDQIIVMNLCGRGDKDVFTVGKPKEPEFLNNFSTLNLPQNS
jgi:tryptophan synthase beta subunit